MNIFKKEKAKTSKRCVSVGVSLNIDEFNLLRDAARQDGCSLSSYIRSIFFDERCITTKFRREEKSRQPARNQRAK